METFKKMPWQMVEKSRIITGRSAKRIYGSLERSEGLVRMIKTEIMSVELEFESNETVFSPSSIDEGTLSMLSQVQFQPNDKVLDLGCGYGVVGILASRLIGEENVTICDISEEAILLSRRNAARNQVPDIRIVKSDGLRDIGEEDFTLILSNPPYHVDFSVPKEFIESGFRKLIVGGKMLMVTKRKTWYQNKLTAVFGGVKVIEVNGYFVFIAEKRSMKPQIKPKNKTGLSKKLQRKRGK